MGGRYHPEPFPQQLGAPPPQPDKPKGPLLSPPPSSPPALDEIDGAGTAAAAGRRGEAEGGQQLDRGRPFPRLGRVPGRAESRERLRSPLRLLSWVWDGNAQLPPTVLPVPPGPFQGSLNSINSRATLQCAPLVWALDQQPTWPWLTPPTHIPHPYTRA